MIDWKQVAKGLRAKYWPEQVMYKRLHAKVWSVLDEAGIPWCDAMNDRGTLPYLDTTKRLELLLDRLQSARAQVRVLEGELYRLTEDEDHDHDHELSEQVANLAGKKMGKR